MNRTHSTRQLKICSGPGCKAWESEKILDLVRDSINQPDYSGNTRICRIPCMNKCGGGVSIELSPSGKLLKLREPNQVLKLLNSE